MMTASILLVRHAAHSQLGRVLSGRAGEVPLSADGHAEAAQLAERLSRGRLDAVHSSPVRRAQETARAIAAKAGCEVTLAASLDEIDFGEWSGTSFAALAEDPRWQAWNERREVAATPAGETMGAVQQRVLTHLRRAARTMAGKVVAMISHADVIRAAVAGVLDLPLGRILAFDIDPASVTRIEAGAWGERLVTLNERAV